MQQLQSGILLSFIVRGNLKMYNVLLLTPMQSKIGPIHVRVGRIPVAGDKVSFAKSEDDSDKKVLYVAEVEEVVLNDDFSRRPYNEDVEQTRAMAYIKEPIFFSKYSSTRG